MTKNTLNFTLLFVILVLAQAILFNNLVLFGVAIPIVFIYWILILPVNLNLNWALTFSFLLGLTVDIFSDTQGMNALACTILAMSRLPILRLYFPREEDMANPVPSLKSLGPAPYTKYIFTATVLYCALYFIIEAFSFFNVWRLITSILASGIVSFLIILAFSTLFHRNFKK